VIERHLDDFRCPVSLAPHQGTRGPYGYRARVVVGVAAFVGVGEHDLHPGKPISQRRGDPREVLRGFLVGPAERHQPLRRDARERHRCLELYDACSRVILGGPESARLRIGQTTRRTVRQMKDKDVRKPG
jgi:hypothetical protein